MATGDPWHTSCALHGPTESNPTTPNLLYKEWVFRWVFLRENQTFFMDQKLEGTPSVEIKLEGRTVLRSEVQNNWGTRLQWRLLKEGKEIATGPVGPDSAFDLPDLQQGRYQVVVQQFHYVNYKKTPDGKFTDSKYVDICKPLDFSV